MYKKNAVVLEIFNLITFYFIIIIFFKVNESRVFNDTV